MARSWVVLLVLHLLCASAMRANLQSRSALLLAASQKGSDRDPVNTNSTAAAERRGPITKMNDWFHNLHASTFARILVTGCVYWMAFASWQMNRDMQLFTNPVRDLGKQTRRARKAVQKTAQKVGREAAPATAKASKHIAAGSAVASFPSALSRSS